MGLPHGAATIHPTGNIISEHMEYYLDPQMLKKRLALACEVLEAFEFDTIAFRGMSGAFLGPSIATVLDKQMILVRKADDDSHSLYQTEGYKDVNRYIIVDDFVSSGSTKKAIIDAVTIFAPDSNFLGLLDVNNISRYRIDELRNHGFPLSSYPLK